jgi:hypothetical protein
LRPISFHEASSAADGPNVGLGAAAFCATQGSTKQAVIVAIKKINHFISSSMSCTALDRITLEGKVSFLHFIRQFAAENLL